MNIFRKTSSLGSPKMGEDKEDLENLLPKGQETPPQLEPLHASEKPRLILGLPVQLVAGAAYCAGETDRLALHIPNNLDLDSASWQRAVTISVWLGGLLLMLATVCSFCEHGATQQSHTQQLQL